MLKIKIPRLEYHLTNSCNLSCESCSHYTNILKGHTKSPDNLEQNLEPWSDLLEIPQFNILGGEPFINKNIDAFCTIARKILPESTIVIYTNGLLLDKIKNIKEHTKCVLDNKIEIQLTYHSLSKDYREKIAPNIKILKYWEKLGIKVTYKDGVSSWTKRYHTDEKGLISPFNDENPQESWNICTCKYCPMLIDDKIYKCAPLAYLPYMKSINKTTADFDPYLQYKPISYKDEIDQIKKFFDKNFQPEDVCKMCPAKEIKIRNKKI